MKRLALVGAVLIAAGPAAASSLLVYKSSRSSRTFAQSCKRK
jgi:hypothetical protein